MKWVLWIDDLRYVVQAFLKVAVKPTIDFVIFKLQVPELVEGEYHLLLFHPGFDLLIQALYCVDHQVLGVIVQYLVSNVIWIRLNLCHVVIEHLADLELYLLVLILQVLQHLEVRFEVVLELLEPIVNHLVCILLHKVEDIAVLLELGGHLVLEVVL